MVTQPMRRAGHQLVLAASLGALVLVIALRFAYLGVDEHHDGMMFKVAQDIFHGSVPFKETFSQYGLLLSLIHAAALKVLGETVASLRTVTALAYGAAGGMLFLVWARFTGQAIAAVAVLAWIAVAPFYMMVMLPWSSVMALPWQAGLILCALAYVERDDPRWLAAASACAAVAFWIRMPVGLLSIITLSVLVPFIAVTRSRGRGCLRPILRDLAYLALAALALSLLPIAYLLARGALNDWFLQTFMMAIYFARTIPQVWSGSEGPLASIATSLLPFHVNWLWPVLALAVLATLIVSGLSMIWSRERANDPMTRSALVIAALSVASWSQFYPVSEERHVFWGSTPMVGVLFFVGIVAVRVLAGLVPERFNRVARWSFGLIATVALAGLFGAPLAKRVEAAGERLVLNSVAVSEPAVLSGLKLTPHESDLFANMDRDLREAQKAFPRARTITNGYDPLALTFGSYRGNWHPLYVYFDIGVAIYPAFPTQLNAYIAAEQPIIISSGTVWPAQKYKAVAHYSNGLSLLVPGHDNSRRLLPDLSRQADVSVELHARMPNLFNLRQPMRVTGHRFGALPEMNEGTVEFVFRPETVEGPYATVLSNLHGPTPMRGLRVHKVAKPFHYAVTVGSKAGLPKAILSFVVNPKACNHIAMRWKDGTFSLSRNGVVVDEARFVEADIGGANQMIVNNGMARLEYHVGQVDELRIIASALSDEEVMTHSRAVARQCSKWRTQ